MRNWKLLSRAVCRAVWVGSKWIRFACGFQFIFSAFSERESRRAEKITLFSITKWDFMVIFRYIIARESSWDFQFIFSHQTHLEIFNLFARETHLEISNLFSHTKPIWRFSIFSYAKLILRFPIYFLAHETLLEIFNVFSRTPNSSWDFQFILARETLRFSIYFLARQIHLENFNLLQKLISLISFACVQWSFAKLALSLNSPFWGFWEVKKIR